MRREFLHDVSRMLGTAATTRGPPGCENAASGKAVCQLHRGDRIREAVYRAAAFEITETNRGQNGYAMEHMAQLWVLAFGAAVGGLVQGISGFAFAMVAMSIWVWGVDPQLAAVMAVFGGVTGQVISAIRVRRGWHLSILWPFLLGSAVGIPIGTRLLPYLDPSQFKLVLGMLLVVCCSAMLATARLPHIDKGARISISSCSPQPSGRWSGPAASAATCCRRWQSWPAH
jgi:hypothetical protein